MKSPTEIYIAKKSSNKCGPFIMAIFAMSAILAVGTFIVVIVPTFEDEPEFISKKSIYLPQKELEHKMAVAEYQQAASSARKIDKISVDNLLNNMPTMPSLPDTEFAPAENEYSVSQAHEMFGNSGLSGALSGLMKDASSISFMGVSDNASKIVIVFDISTSVMNNMTKAGMKIEQIRAETKKLIQSLNANTLFGIIQHSRSYDTFEDHLIPGTIRNKKTAVSWLNSEFKTNGRSGSGWKTETPNGIQAAIKAAFKMQPDVIFLLSDASYQRTKSGRSSENVPWKELRSDIQDFQKQQIKPARIHLIGFGIKKVDRKYAKRLTQENKGTFKEFSSKKLD